MPNTRENSSGEGASKLEQCFDQYKELRKQLGKYCDLYDKLLGLHSEPEDIIRKVELEAMLYNCIRAIKDKSDHTMKCVELFRINLWTNQA